MSVNKYQNGELIKVSGNFGNSSEIYYSDNISGLGVTNIKDAIDKLNINKINTDNILNSLDAATASTNAKNIVGATAVKELNNKLTTINMNTVENMYVGGDGKLHVVKGGIDSTLNFIPPSFRMSNIIEVGHDDVNNSWSRGRIYIPNLGWRKLTFYYKATSSYAYNERSEIFGNNTLLYTSPLTTQSSTVTLNIAGYNGIEFWVRSYGHGQTAGFYDIVFSY